MREHDDSLSLAAVCFRDCGDAPGGFAGAMNGTNTVSKRR
jgi:hypothetical protein